MSKGVVVPWWSVEIAEMLASPETQENAFLVVEYKYHDLPAWEKAVRDHWLVQVSEAARRLLTVVKDGFYREFTEDGKRLRAADIQFVVAADQAKRIQNLLAQKKLDAEGQPRTFSNAYRFTSLQALDVDGAKFLAVANLAIRQPKTVLMGLLIVIPRLWKVFVFWGQVEEEGYLSLIPATTAFQQLLMGYVGKSILENLPRELRAGVCQEVAQQLTSHLKILDKARDKEQVSFPTIEIRDPEIRRREYEQALDDLAHDLEPLAKARLRDVYPGEYANDDPRGDRLTIFDERWFRVTRSAEPHPFTLFFVNGDAVKLVEGSFSFDAGVSKRNRHRGNLVSSDRVWSSRSTKIQTKGTSGLRAWYALSPLLDIRDEEVSGILQKREQAQGRGRGLDLQFRPLPITREAKFNFAKNQEKYLLSPISGDSTRLGRILHRRDLQIAWAREDKAGEEWFLQLTVRVPLKASKIPERVLGVSFGLDAIACWTLVNLDEQVIETGTFSPNPHIAEFIKRKQELESAQRGQKWIGGRKFAPRLESIAHEVVNGLTSLARTHGAALAVESISYAQKSGKNSAQNVLFSTWDYGRLSRYLTYKSPLAGLGQALYVSDFLTAFTCPKCGAIRKKGEKEDKSATWRKDGKLFCRVCGFEGLVTIAERSKRVALEGVNILKQRQN